MKLRIKFADQIVGLFIVIAIALVVVLTVVLAINQRWFVPDLTFRSQFLSAASLSQGMPISFRGFQIGNITDIELNADNRIDVEFSIFENYRDKMVEFSVLELVSSPIGLGSTMVFHQGRPQIFNEESGLYEYVYLEEGAFVPSLEIPQGEQWAQRDLIDLETRSDSINQLISNVNPLLRNVNRTVVLLNLALEGQGKGPVAESFVNLNQALIAIGDAVDSIGTFAEDTGRVVNDLGVSAQSTVGQVETTLDDLSGAVIQVLDSTESIIANLTELSEGISDPEGLVPKLLGAEGSLATLLNDNNQLFNSIDAILKNFVDASADVSATTTSIRGEVPQISSLISQTREAIITAQDVLEGLRNNPLLSGGISERQEQEAIFESLRNDFE